MKNSTEAERLVGKALAAHKADDEAAVDAAMTELAAYGLTLAERLVAAFEAIALNTTTRPK